MEIREATATDAERIAQVARASLDESYGHFVDGDTIDEVVDEWYGETAVTDLLEEGATVVLVAEEDDDVIAFAQGAVVEGEPPVGELHWLHVDPAERGQELGVQLLGEMHDRFENRGASVLRGLVLSGNDDGTTFYENNDFASEGSRSVEVAGETYEELVYEQAIGDEPAEQVVREVAGPEGLTLYVNFSDAERGNEGPFYPTFSDEGFEDRYGWFCGNCETVDNAMDSMGRIQCNECGNRRKASRWDASYL
ncbi:GNAT family N-acetyltransferase [Halobacteriales archaeon Cl-PHB]